MGTLVQNRQILSGKSTSLSIHWSRSVHRNSEMPTLGAGSSAAHQTVRNVASEPCPPALDCPIWSNLQPELVARILAHLPLTALIHTRLVTRKWDREVYSARVLATDGSIHDAPRSWLFLFENGGPGNPHTLHAFDPVRNDWQTLTTIPHFATMQKIGGLSLCGAASGLMVYKISALKSHFIRFGVFNPITRSWKKLPPLLKRRQRPVAAMFTENHHNNGSKFGTRRSPAGGHYKLVVAGGLEYGQQVQTTEVYDSRTECWHTTCEKFNNQPSHVCEEMRTTTAFCDGVVYHLRFNQMLSFDPHREYHTFMAYETKTAQWRPLRIPLPRNLVFTEYPSLKRMWKGQEYMADVLQPFLVECKRRLLLIGFIENRCASTIASVGVWELYLLPKKMWKLITAMPESFFCQMCPKVCIFPYVDPLTYLRYELEGAGHGDVVYMFVAEGGVVECNLGVSPPAWRWIWRSGFVGGEGCQSVHGCIIDLRLDSFI